MANETVHLKIQRFDGPSDPGRWEEFAVPKEPLMNVIGCLQAIQRDPKTADGRTTTPVTWESSCLEEVCGACTMIVNGRVRQACAALVDELLLSSPVIELRPMTKFPRVRDLVVDRTRMFENLKRVKAWIRLDGSHELGAGPRVKPEVQELMYPLSRCMTCGCCIEACPQTGSASPFMGPEVVNQVWKLNLHPSGETNATERLETLMGRGGLADCGKAQNCVEVCPKEIPLTDGISAMGRAATKHMLFGWLFR